jgi:type IV pilus assembly protein PilO
MALQDSLEQLKSVELSDLDFNNIGSWPAALKGLVMLIALALILVVGYSLYLSDKRAQLQVAAGQEQNLRNDFMDKAEKSANLEAYLQQKKEMEETFGALLRQLPSDTEVPGLLEDITRTAIDNELKIESITLKPEVNTEFYVELPIDIVVEGSYHKIGSFVSSVANLPRIVTLHNFEIEPVAGPDNLRMMIVAKTYRYLEDA